MDFYGKKKKKINKNKPSSAYFIVRPKLYEIHQLSITTVEYITGKFIDIGYPSIF